MMVKDGVGLVFAAPVVLALALATEGRALAHPEFSAMGTNRYVTAAVLDGRVDVTDSWLEGALSAVETRHNLDGNRDGRIDAAELRAAQDNLVAQGMLVGIEIDGAPARGVPSVSIDLGDEPRVGPTPLVIETRTTIDRRPSRLRLVVEREPARLQETEVGIVFGPGLALERGPDRVSFHGARGSALENRAATFEIGSTASPPSPSPSSSSSSSASPSSASPCFEDEDEDEDGGEN